jgi:hypothetical protein
MDHGTEYYAAADHKPPQETRIFFALGPGDVLVTTSILSQAISHQSIIAPDTTPLCMEAYHASRYTVGILLLLHANPHSI